MNKMLVCMDYTQDGSRTITDLYFDVTDSHHTIQRVSSDYTECHDEVYIVDFDPNDITFINAIVKEGCKI